MEYSGFSAIFIEAIKEQQKLFENLSEKAEGQNIKLEKLNKESRSLNDKTIELEGNINKVIRSIDR